jgi:DNA-binding CsgD family transcriptional regulator
VAILSPKLREVEVLALVAKGLRNAERAGRALTHEKRATTTSQLL